MPSLRCLFIWGGGGAEVNCFNPGPRKVLTWHSVCMGGDFKIRTGSCWAMTVFVLVLSNINIVWQKLLSAILRSRGKFDSV